MGLAANLDLAVDELLTSDLSQFAQATDYDSVSFSGVLANGQNRFSGTGAELIADPDVARSFLGGEAKR